MASISKLNCNRAISLPWCAMHLNSNVYFIAAGETEVICSLSGHLVILLSLCVQICEGEA